MYIILFFTLPHFYCFAMPQLTFAAVIISGRRFDAYAEWHNSTFICRPPLCFTLCCLIVFVNLQQWQRKAISLCCAVCEISTVVCNSLWKILVFLSYPTIREIIDCEDTIAISHDTCLSCWVLTNCSIFLELDSTLLYCSDIIQLSTSAAFETEVIFI